MKNVIIFFFFYLSEAPLIYLSLRGKYFIEGSPVTVACTGSGKPPPDVAWIRNGVLESLGKKSASLEFDNINRKDAGQYTCRANNSVEVTSINTTIVVHCKYYNLNFLFLSLLYLQCESCYWGQLPKTDESVQSCKETEFHLNSFSALCASAWEVLVGTIEYRWNNFSHYFVLEGATIFSPSHCFS